MTGRATPRIASALLASSLAALGAAAPRSARADGWALDRYEPTPAGDTFFAADFPWYNSTRLFAMALVGDYARQALVLRAPGGDAQPRVLVDNMFVLHAQGSIALFDRIGINFSLPVSAYQNGDALDPRIPVGSSRVPSAGDIRLGLRVRLFGHADRDPFSLHIGGQAYLGMIEYTDRDYLVTDEAFRARGYVTMAGHAGPVRWSFTGGFHYRPQHVIAATTIESDVYVNAALGFVADHDRLTIGPEFFGSTMVSEPFGYGRNNGEVILGVHYLVADALLLSVGGGPGLTEGGAGTPQIRGLARIAYAPVARPARAAPPGDADGDGVIDREDLCVTEPAGSHPDPARAGCPLRDTDGDGVFDAEDMCPTEPRGARPDPARAGCPLHDTDGDTVFDPDDQCVDVPRGEHPDPDRAGCPDGDEDQDGVRNHDDQCRDVPAGPHPDPARAGCPVPDRDHDTVPDGVDHCPDVPGAPHPDPNRNGCPGLVRVENGMVRIMRPVFFATGRDRILPQSFAVLQAVADALQASPDVRRIAVEGHTDNAGPDARNLQLSQRRADSIMRFMVEHGMAAARVEAHGYGETRPVADNGTRAGRALNRRVDFRIVDPPPSETPAGSTAPPAGSAAPPAAATPSTRGPSFTPGAQGSSAAPASSTEVPMFAPTRSSGSSAPPSSGP